MFSQKVIIIPLKNLGLDFGLWSQFFQIYSTYFKNLDELILVNDSCYCLNSLQSIYLKNKNLLMWGITDSYEHKYHLQSYFLSFNSKQSIKSVLEYFKIIDFTKFTSKHDTIFVGEIGLSQYMMLQKYEIHAEYQFYKLKRNSNNKNSAFSFWKELRTLKCPIIKKIKL